MDYQRLALQLDALKDQQRKHELTLAQARNATTTALVGILIGLLLLFTPLALLGVLILLAGLLAAATQYTKRKAAQTALQTIETQINDLRNTGTP